MVLINKNATDRGQKPFAVKLHHAHLSVKVLEINPRNTDLRLLVKGVKQSVARKANEATEHNLLFILSIRELQSDSNGRQFLKQLLIET